VARLPKPGQDTGSWGDILNDFLSVEHNVDGSLKKGTDIADKISSSLATSKGDILAATAAHTIARVEVGTNGQVLTADTASNTGIKWTTPTSAPVTSVVGQTGIITGAQIAADSALVSTYANKSYTDLSRQQFRVREIPGIAGIPQTSSTLLTPTSAATTQYSGAVLIRMDTPGAFTYTGGIPSKGSTFPDDSNYGTSGTYANSTSPPWAIEFELDTVDSTGRFELYLRAVSNSSWRVSAATGGGPLQYVTSVIPGSGTNAFHIVPLGAAGRYRVRIEFAATARFYGIYVGATDAVHAVRAPSRRLIVPGDSYTEPTIQDNSASAVVGAQGWVGQLAHMLGAEPFPCGSGGTGYLATNNGIRMTARQRSADWLSVIRRGDLVLFALGINDRLVNGGGSLNDAAAVAAEAGLCFDLAIATGAEVGVISPFWPKGFEGIATNILAMNRQIKAQAIARGLKFYDLLNLADNTGAAATTTLSSAATVGATSVSAAVSLPVNTYIQIGSDSDAEVRKITGVSGSGPYSLQFTGTGGGGVLSRAHTSGTPVYLAGPSYLTGNGYQGTTNNSGNADRFTGGDGTHPTLAGHYNIAAQVHALYTKQLDR